MKRCLVAIGCTIGLCGLAPAGASAAIIQVGATSTPVIAPACPKGIAPAQCTIILTRATALETIRDNVAYPTTVTKAGQLVAFTVGLSSLSTDRATMLSDIAYLNRTYGGGPQVAITVLRPVGDRTLRRWQVVAQSPLYQVQSYLGTVARFWLARTLPVQPGDAIGLTTPTWAPVLSIDLSTKQFAYRQSRMSNCDNPAAKSQAQVTVGQSARYGCDYPGTRVEYGATEVAPVSTSTAVTELGATTTPIVTPLCPNAKCAVTPKRVTALPTISDGVAYPTTVTTAGRIVAFTVGLSALGGCKPSPASCIHSLDQAAGGTAEVVLTVLKPVGAATSRRWRVAAESPAFQVQAYLGNVVQIPLATSVAVQPGEVIALTTPTWAPVLSISLPSASFAYRQSRSANCASPPVASQAQITVGQSTPYICSYAGSRVEISVSEVPSTTATKRGRH